MLHWHGKACRRPDVYPAGDVPFCASCDRTAPPRLEAGPTETRYYVGKSCRSLLNMTWPSSVQYVDECVLDDTGRDFTDDLIRSLNLELDSPNSTSSSSAPSHSTTGFQPLLARHEIRVLHIQPGEWDDPLHGTLEHVDIQRGAKFEALSYSWANEACDTSRTRPLFIGLSWDVLPITVNCEGALRRLRSRKKVRRLWVDAVCINQANPSEQSHQVGLMDHIYSNAKRCLVYLGEHSGGSRVAMRYLKNVYDRPEFPEAATQVVSELFARRYFSRLWILQEIVLARDVYVHCGDSAVRWELALWNLRRQFPQADFPVWVRDFELLRMNGPADFPRFLFQTSSSSTSDPRDRIFALFGLLNGVEKEGLSADYALSFEQVYTGVAAYLLKQRLSLILYCCSADKEPGLPSWVPDWRRVEPGHWDPTSLETFPASITARDLHTELESKFPAVYLSTRYFHQALAGVQPTLNHGVAVHSSTGGLLITMPIMIRLSGFSRHESYNNVLTRDIPDDRGKTIVLSSTSQIRENDYIAALGDGDVFLLLRSCVTPRSYKVFGYCLLSMLIPDRIPGCTVTEVRSYANALFREDHSTLDDEIATKLEGLWMEDIRRPRVRWHNQLDSAARQALGSTTHIQDIPRPLKPKADLESSSGIGGDDILVAAASGLQSIPAQALETSITRSYSFRLWKDENRSGLLKVMAADIRRWRLTDEVFWLFDTLRQSIKTFNSYLRTPRGLSSVIPRTFAMEAYVICNRQQTSLSDILKTMAQYPTSINYQSPSSKALENLAHILWTIITEGDGLESESVGLFEDVIGMVFQQLRQVQGEILEMLGQLWMCKVSNGTKTVVYDEQWQPAIRAAAIILEWARGKRKRTTWRYFRAPAYFSLLWAFEHLWENMMENQKAIIL